MQLDSLPKESIEINEIWKIFDLMRLSEVPEVYDNGCSKCIDGGYIIEDTTEGIFVCSMCGLIKKGQIMDENNDCINYQNETNSVDKIRHSPINPLYPQSSFSTIIVGNSKMSKINRWNSMPYKERALWETVEYIKRQCEPFNISTSVINIAVSLFQKIDNMKKDNGKKEIHRGNIRHGIIAACLYYAFKAENLDRTPIEVSEIMNIDIIHLTKGCKIFLDIIEHTGNYKSEFEINIKPPIPNDFLFRFCNELQLDFKCFRSIENVLNKVIELDNLSRNTPISIAAGILYFSLFYWNYEITKKKVAVVCKISDVTISKIFKLLVPFKNKIL
jgi:transcription initiation factor TFIIB